MCAGLQVREQGLSPQLLESSAFLLHLHNSRLWNLWPLVWELEVSEDGCNQGGAEIGKIVKRCLENGRGKLSKLTGIIGV